MTACDPEPPAPPRPGWTTLSVGVVLRVRADDLAPILRTLEECVARRLLSSRPRLKVAGAPLDLHDAATLAEHHEP